jgi:cytochrome c-type biogenesis protein CcmH
MSIHQPSVSRMVNPVFPSPTSILGCGTHVSDPHPGLVPLSIPITGRRAALPVIVLLWLTASAIRLPAQEPAGGVPASATRLTDAQESRAQELEGRLKCPVCRTQSVRESTSFMALEMRTRIRELIAAGKSDREVLEYFVERYGDYILLEPRKRGFGISAYVLPLLAVLVGAALIVGWLSARRAPVTRAPAGGPGAPGSTRPARTAAPASLSPAENERVDRELKRYTA